MRGARGWTQTVVLTIAAIGATAGSPPSGPSPSAGSFLIDRETTCEDPFVPSEYGTTGMLSAGAPIPVDVLVLLDGVSAEDAMPKLQAASASYEPLGIELRFLEPRPFTPTDVEVSGGGYVLMSSYYDAARDHLGGQRPEGVEAVYLLTTHDFRGGWGLWVGGVGGQQLMEQDYGGQVDCVGGIRDRRTGFGVGEWIPEGTYPDDPVFGPFGDLTTHIFAHELGHILGGRHDFGDCYAGLLYEAPDEPHRRCTLMTPAAGPTTTDQIHPINRGVMRAYVEEYAD